MRKADGKYVFLLHVRGLYEEGAIWVIFRDFLLPTMRNWGI